jgi:hypothetical protein
VHAHVPPQVRGQVAQDHLLLPSLQARTQVIDAYSTPTGRMCHLHIPPPPGDEDFDGPVLC